MARFEDTFAPDIKKGGGATTTKHRPDTLNTLTSEERDLKPFQYNTKGRKNKYET